MYRIKILFAIAALSIGLTSNVSATEPVMKGGTSENNNTSNWIITSETSLQFMEPTLVEIKIGNDFLVELNSNAQEVAEIEIVSSGGKLIRKVQIGLDHGINYIKFKVSEIPKGAYFIRVHSNGETAIKTLFVN